MNTQHTLATDYHYCITSKINLNSDRAIKDGKDIAYLLPLTKTLISSKSPLNNGILESYSFSADGLSFTAKIKKNVWSNGSPVKVEEIVTSITKALPKKNIGSKIQIKNFKLIDNETFQLHFVSKVKNTTGEILSAFLPNARHNRIWISKKVKNKTLFISKYPKVLQLNEPEIIFNNDKILISDQSSKHCKKPDFTVFPEYIDSAEISEYESVEAKGYLQIILQIKSTKNIFFKKQIANFVHNAFKYSKLPGLESSDGFFINGEPGFSNQVKWEINSDENFNKLNKATLNIAFELPFMKDILLKYAQLNNIKLNLISFPITAHEDQLDAQIMATAIKKGQLVFLQDALSWPLVETMLKKNPKTLSYLQRFSSKSSLSIPNDEATLSGFSKIAFSEFSILPIARKKSLIMSKKNIPYKLQVDETGELEFVSK